MMSSRQLLPLLTTGVALLLAVSGRGAVPSPLLSLTSAQAGGFQQALNALAKQGHVAFVAEGMPLHPRLSPPDAAKLTVAASLDNDVKAIADAYDYTAQRESDVFILKKRYSDPDDLPAITEAECEHALMLMQRVADPYNPHAPPDRFQDLVPSTSNMSRDQYRVISPLINPFIASLTPDQLDAMHNNKLRLSSLSQDQQAQAHQVRLLLYVQQPMEQVAMVSPQLARTEETALFRWQDTREARHVFGYSLPKRPEERRSVFQSLTQSNTLGSLGIFVLAPPAPLGPDPTDPTPTTLPADVLPAQTLAEAVAAVNARPGAPHAEVDAGLASKPVTLAGSGNAPAKQVLQALADVYGLRLMDTAPGSAVKITLPDVAPPSDLAALPSSLRQTLPEPFRRAAHMDAAVADEQQIQDVLQPAFSGPKASSQAPLPPDVAEMLVELEHAIQEFRWATRGPTDFDVNSERITKDEAAFPALRVAAIRRLRALIEPKLQTKPDGVALADLGEPEHEAIAAIFLAEVVQAEKHLLLQPMPDDMLHLDRAVLSGGIVGNSKHPEFFLSFNTLMSTGQVMPGDGIGGMDYIPDYNTNRQAYTSTKAYSK